MDVIELIDRFYKDQDPFLRSVLLTHSRSVADKALSIAEKHPEFQLDTSFLQEAALLHDIGIFRTDAPGLKCYGEFPYICHGYLGADLLREVGLPRHALVCERHTGAGIPLAEIVQRKLPLPRRDMLPVSMEEQVICFADKFFSKTRLEEEKSIEAARKSVAKHGEEGSIRFDEWCKLFL